MKNARLTAIYDVAQVAPLQALFGAVIKMAVFDAQSGDQAAADWLAGERCRWFLSWLLPDDSPEVTIESLQTCLLEQLRPAA